MERLVMGMNHGMDTKENIDKKKNVLMDYLLIRIRVRMNIILSVCELCGIFVTLVRERY